MKIIKQFETKMNISPAEMYAGDLNQLLVDKLRNNFENKCEDGSYVVSIQEILKRSKIKIDKSDLRGGGTISIRFSAEVIVYPQGSILVGCSIKNIENNGHILCQYENALVYIRGDKNTQIPASSRLIVEVLHTKYPKGSGIITVFGSMFHITNAVNMIIVKPDDPKNVSQEQKDAIQVKLQELNTAQKELEKHPKKLVKFFSDMFYPIRKEISIPKDLGKLDVAKIAQDIVKNKSPINSGNSIIICKHPALRREDTTILMLDPRKNKNVKNSWMNPQFFNIKINPFGYINSIMHILQIHVEYTAALSRMCEEYKTEASRNQHDKLWKIYDRIKIELS